MKKLFSWKTGARWYVLAMIVIMLTGCETLANLMGFDYDESPDGPGGCTFREMDEFFGCSHTRPYTIGPSGFTQYDLLGRSRSDQPNARDMGFGQDVPEYRPINESSSSD